MCQFVIGWSWSTKCFQKATEHSLSGQCRFNVLGYFLGLVHRRIALKYTAITPHQKFGEVPLNGLAAQQARRLSAQPLVERVRFWAIHIDLLHHGESHAVIDLAKICNDRVARRILAAKLIAGET